MTPAQPTFGGVPLKYISLVTLTCQNSLLTVLLAYSRSNVAPDKMYSAASAVLLNEILKGTISCGIAFYGAVHEQPSTRALTSAASAHDEKRRVLQGDKESWTEIWEPKRLQRAFSKMRREIFSSDSWKLSIPACLYVIQNNLQFVAASNLDAPTFQVSYNLKILTTALFSVLLLKRRLSGKKWIALVLLAAGVGIVQIQSSAPAASSSSHEMNRLKGLLAVASGCMTSGMAGVYFEKVLKGSKVDLWTRNCQLSFFSMLPALVPVFLPNLSFLTSSSVTPVVHAPTQWIFANFGFWAWSVVLTQVLGGLVTALVIKYSDNILKGFATSLAIVLSFIAGVILFEFQVTPSFLIGTVVVCTSTWLYNQPDSPEGLQHLQHSPLSPPPTPGTPSTYSKHQSFNPFFNSTPPSYRRSSDHRTAAEYQSIDGLVAGNPTVLVNSAKV